MDQNMESTEMRAVVVGGTTTLAVALWLLLRRQATLPVAEGNSNMFDCIVCLCEVSPGDEYRKLPNCEHGVQFHGECIEAWLKNHSTCPMCRSQIPRPLLQCLQTYVFEHLLEDVISYCNTVLDNVATSIGDCRDF